MNSPDKYHQLVKGIQNGDEQCMELLFRRLYPSLCVFATKFLGDIDDAEDIVQEAFFKTWKNRANLDENKSIQSYLYTAVKNSCFNFLEHRRSTDQYAKIMATVYLHKKSDADPYESVIAGELENRFRHVLDQLPAQCRKIFELSRFEGLKYHEIAEKLNISIKTVETQMSRALTKMRLQLKGYILTIQLFLPAFFF